MDALVAYLQMLGTLVDFSTYDARKKTTGRRRRIWKPISPMRHFADSWGLVYMFAFSSASFVWVLPPRRQEGR
jgi:hypothetical protein